MPSTIRNLAAWKAAGQEPITLHECRNALASWIIASGEQPKAIQAFMGGATIQMTFDRYGHLMPGSRPRRGALGRIARRPPLAPRGRPVSGRSGKVRKKPRKLRSFFSSTAVTGVGQHLQ